MGFIDVNGVSLSLSDGRPLLPDLSFRVTDAATTALIGANGAGTSTLLLLVSVASTRVRRAGSRTRRARAPVTGEAWRVEPVR